MTLPSLLCPVLTAVEAGLAWLLRRKPRAALEWNGSPEWSVDAAAERLSRFIEGRCRFPVDTGRNGDPVPYAALIMLFWPIPVAPPPDDQNHPIRGPPLTTKSEVVDP